MTAKAANRKPKTASVAHAGGEARGCSSSTAPARVAAHPPHVQQAIDEHFADGMGSRPSMESSRLSASGNLGELIERFKAQFPPETFWIGVAGRFDGYGDWLIRCALARAADLHWQSHLPGWKPGAVGVMVLGQVARQPDDLDLSQQPGVDVALRLPPMHWLPRAYKARQHFDVFYEVQYVVRTSFANPVRWQLEQQAADARLADFQALYDGFPHSARLLATRLAISQWHLMSHCAGFEVSPVDLYVPTDCAKAEGFDRVPVADLDAHKGCVTLHNGQGDSPFGTKTLPPDVMPAIAAALNRRGIRAVQLGIRDDDREPPICGAVDLRGLRVPETARVIQNARLHVDVEGGTAIIAAAVRTPSVIFFGPTAPIPFGFEGNVNHTRAICPKPHGPHCFWSTDDWSRRCPLGFEHCVNHPQPEAAVRVVLEQLDKLEPRK